MNRRDWLESVLGIFAGCQIPWIARRPDQSAIPQPESVNPGFTTRLTLNDGEVIQGPGVTHIRPVNGKARVTLASVEVSQQLVYRGLLVYYQGRLLSDIDFEAIIGANPGDRIEIDYTLSIDYHGKPIDSNHPDFQHILDRWRSGQLSLNRRRSAKDVLGWPES